VDPFLIPRAAIAWIAFWWRFWSRILGRKVLLALTALSTLAVVVLIVLKV